MKNQSLLLMFLAASALSYLNSRAEINDLDLIILQDPKAELKTAVKKAQLEKLVRIIRLINQGKLNLEMFKDPSLLTEAEEAEVKANHDSKKYLFFKSLFWASLIGIGLYPAGAVKSEFIQGGIRYRSPHAIGLFPHGELDYSLLWTKVIIMLAGPALYLRIMNDVKASWKRNGALVKQLVEKYHEKSLAL